MIQSEGLVKRKNASLDSSIDEAATDPDKQATGDSDVSEQTVLGTELSLMEEVFLLGLKSREGTVSIWNDMLSIGLRGCILIELGLRGKIELESAKMGRRSLLRRKVLVKDPSPTGDVVMDEALKHLTATFPTESVDSWIGYLSGETWNPLKLKYQLKSVQNRIAKNLVEKGVLATQMKNYLLFDTTTYPLVDPTVKNKVIKKVIDALLLKWINDPQKMDKRLLSLVMLAHVSDVLDNALSMLDNEDYYIVSKRIKELLELDLEAESAKGSCCDILWAVFAYFK